MIFNLSISLGIVVFFVAFFAEYFDSSLGMGYGTTLTPVLLFMGYEPLQIIPVILLSEMITGIFAGFAHHRFGNVDFKPKTNCLISIIKKDKKTDLFSRLRKNLSRHLKISLLIASCSIIGTVAAVFLAINLPRIVLKIYIGILILVIGFFILLTRTKNYQFSWKKLAAMGILAAFNKGMSGGGYGPVVTGGQLLAGVESKSAIAITSLAEGITCLVGISVYILLKPSIDWVLAPYLIAGAILSVPLSAFTVKSINTRNLQLFIGIMTLVLGIFCVGKIVFYDLL